MASFSPVKNHDDPRSPTASSRGYSTARNYPETTATQDDRGSSKANYGNYDYGSPEKNTTYGRRNSTATTTARRDSILTTPAAARPRRDSAATTPTVPVIREPIALSEPRVPEIYDPAYKRPTAESEPRAAAEWDFLGSSKKSSAHLPRSDVSSTGAVANNVIAPKFSISDRKRQLGLTTLKARPDEEEEVIVEESDQQIKENLAKANLNLTLNELLTKTRISGEDGS